MTERTVGQDTWKLAQTRWTVGTLALFGTLIAILAGIGQLRP